ncbi:MAG: hypothetical protein Q7S11_00045, partial [bacterium]|nr:hypothetical protein [bacterium]
VQDASKSSTTYVTVTAPLPPQASQAGSIVYSETIGWGWDVGTWPNVIVNPASPNAYRGDNGIEMQTTAQWGRVQLLAESNFKFNTTGYESLSFAINIGANEEEDLYVGLLNVSGGVLQYQNIRNYAENGTLNSYQWKHIRIPLSALSGLNTDVYGVEIQSTNPTTLYFDEVQFELNGTNGGCQ